MCEIKFDRIQVAVIMQTSQTFAIKSKVRLRAPGITILHVFINNPGNTQGLYPIIFFYHYLLLVFTFIPNQTLIFYTFQLTNSLKRRDEIPFRRQRILWDRWYYSRLGVIHYELFQSSCENFVKVDSDEEEVSINQSRQEDLRVGGRGETCLLQTLSCFLVKAGSWWFEFWIFAVKDVWRLNQLPWGEI